MVKYKRKALDFKSDPRQQKMKTLTQNKGALAVKRSTPASWSLAQVSFSYQNFVLKRLSYQNFFQHKILRTLRYSKQLSSMGYTAGTKQLAFCNQNLARRLLSSWRSVSSGKFESYCSWANNSKLPTRICERLSTHATEPSLTLCTNANVFPFLTPLDQPPRPPPPPPSTATSARYLAGYNPARGDFSSLPEPTLELLLTNLAVPESDLEEELQCTLVRAYNHRLKQRLRKLSLVGCSSQIIRTHFRQYPSQVKEHGLLTRRSRLPPPWHRFSSFHCALDLAFLIQVSIMEGNQKNMAYEN